MDEMLNLLESFKEQAKIASRLGKNVIIDRKVKRIIIAGLGGSGIAGELLKSYLSKEKIPIETCKDYFLPENVDEETLIFALSYSGDSEETLSCYKHAQRRNCTIVGISSGGKIIEWCRRDKMPYILLPQGIPQRISTAYLFFPMLNVLIASNIIKDRAKDISSSINSLDMDFRNAAKKISTNIGKKLPLFYSSQRFSAIAQKWKIDINENTKIAAFYNVFPEFNHNELNAYTNKTIDIHAIIIKDDEEHERIRKRMEVFESIIKKRGYTVTEVKLTGDCYLSKLLSAILLGLYISYYLAQSYGIDPIPVPLVKELKEALR